MLRNWQAAVVALGVTFASTAMARTSGANEVPTSAAPTPIPVKATELQSLTFTRLVIRLTGADVLGVAREEYTLQFLEELRRNGYPALGAENIVFGQDKAAEAQFALGATLTDAQCTSSYQSLDSTQCRIAVQWELLDRKSEHVVYRVLTRAHGAGSASPRDLLISALRSLLTRSKFVEALKKPPAGASQADAQAQYAQAQFLQCAAVPAPMPASAETAVQATVVVETETGHGSGTIVSPDGFVVTAAHVVTGASKISVRTRNGATLDAKVIRLNTSRDAALLKFESPGAQPCLPIRLERVHLGDELYAIGAPITKELAFSLSRGIVSGFRDADGVSMLQTDASINPGNSGGPLVDAGGRWVAVVKSKGVGQGVEGLGFGVAAADALEGLGISPGAATEAPLRTPNALPAATVKPAVEDTADVLSELPPNMKRSTAGRILLFAGIPVAVVGLVFVTTSYLTYDKSGTRSQYESARTINDVSWVALGLGTAAIVAGVLLPSTREPPPVSPKVAAAPPRPTWSAGIGLGSVSFQVRY